MALKKDIIITKAHFDGELKASDVYCKVESLKGSKEKQQAEVCMYAQNQIIDRKFYEFAPDMNGENFIKQAYLHLKSLEEFSGSTDC